MSLRRAPLSFAALFRWQHCVDLPVQASVLLLLLWLPLGKTAMGQEQKGTFLSSMPCW